MNAIPTIRIFGEHTILLDWPPVIDLSTHQKVMACSEFIRVHYADYLVDLAPAYHSLTLFLKPSISPSLLIKKLRTALKNAYKENPPQQYLFTLPVCYDLEFGWDLEEMAYSKDRTIEEIIELHTAAVYKVYFIGFLPGFPYLGGLDPDLETERKPKPRPLIEKGSIGIGGAQTGIYPRNSPGGWNIIGRTPLELFDPSAPVPTKINAGDYIKFEAVTRDEYNLVTVEAETDTFQWRKEVYHD